MTRNIGSKLIGYVDLFAGCGRFDNAESSPLLIIRKAAGDPALRKALLTFFNDQEARAIEALRKEVGAIEGVDRFEHPPKFASEPVTPGIINQLSDFRKIPTLLFADPFGYKGISLELLRLLLANRKSEALIFFNTNRIIPGMSNEFVSDHIDALFGKNLANEVRARLDGVHGGERERIVLDSFEQGLKNIGFGYVLRFRFLSQTADRTSHHLFHCSRHAMAEKKMKETMDRYSARSLDDVPLFQVPQEDFGQGSLFEEPLPPEDLAQDLLCVFAGRSLTLDEIVTSHSPRTPYVDRNYRKALWHLIDAGVVTCDPSESARAFKGGKRVWSKTTRVCFPHNKK